MRYVRFRHADTAKFGAVVEDGIVDLSARWPSLKAAIAAKALPDLEAATRNAQPDFRLDEVEMTPVIPDPEKILCVGINYATHVAEMALKLPTEPNAFTRLHNTLAPPPATIVRPHTPSHF